MGKNKMTKPLQTSGTLLEVENAYNHYLACKEALKISKEALESAGNQLVAAARRCPVELADILRIVDEYDECPEDEDDEEQQPLSWCVKRIGLLPSVLKVIKRFGQCDEALQFKPGSHNRAYGYSIWCEAQGAKPAKRYEWNHVGRQWNAC